MGKRHPGSVSSERREIEEVSPVITPTFNLKCSLDSATEVGKARQSSVVSLKDETS